MKKLLSVLAIAAVMTACKNEKAPETPVDSVKIADSIAKAKAAMDTAAKKMDSAAVKVDSAAKKVDSAAKK